MPTNSHGGRPTEGGGSAWEEWLNRLTLTLVGQGEEDEEEEEGGGKEDETGGVVASSTSRHRTLVPKTTPTRTHGSVSSQSSRRSSTWEKSYVFASSVTSFSTRRLGGDIHSKLQDSFERDLAVLARSSGLVIKSLSGRKGVIRHGNGHGRGLLNVDEMLSIGAYLAEQVEPAVEVPAAIINKLLKVIRIRDKDNAWHENFARGTSRVQAHKIFLSSLDELAALLIEARARWKRETGGE